MNLLQAIPSLYAGSITSITADNEQTTIELFKVRGELMITAEVGDAVALFPLNNVTNDLVYENFTPTWLHSVPPDDRLKQLDESWSDNTLLNGINLLFLGDITKIVAVIEQEYVTVTISEDKDGYETLVTYKNRDLLNVTRFTLTRELYESDWTYFYDANMTKTI